MLLSDKVVRVSPFRTKLPRWRGRRPTRPSKGALMETALSWFSASGFSLSMGGPTWNSKSPRLTAWPSLTRIAARCPSAGVRTSIWRCESIRQRYGCVMVDGLRLDDGDRDLLGVVLRLPPVRIALGQVESDQQQDERLDP